MKIFILIWCGLISYPLIGQNSNTSTMPVTFSYFGENFLNPGLKVGIEYPLLANYKSKEKRNNTSATRHNNIFVTGNAGFFAQPKIQTGLFLNSEIGFRSIKHYKRIREILIGVGYLQSFLNAPVFEDKDGDGVFEKRATATQSNFMPSLTAGYAFPISSSSVVSLWRVRLHLLGQFPNNADFAIRPALELGVALNFKNIKLLRIK